MKKIYFVLFAIACGNLFSQSGIHFQFHKNNVLNAPYVLNKDTFYNITSVGLNSSSDREMSLLSPSSNSWKYYQTPLSPTVGFSMVMKDRKNGIIYNNTASYYTTDEWATSTQFTMTAYPVGATSFGYYGYNTTAGNQMYFSQNGLTWTAVGGTVSGISFRESPNKVFNFTGDKLHYSTNGGQSYSTISYTTQMTGGLHAPSDDTLYLFDYTSAKKSFDGGNTWQNLPLPFTDPIKGVACKNGKEILLYQGQTWSTYAHYSNDAGATWTQISNPPVIPVGETLMATRDYFMIYPSKKSVNGSAWTDIYVKKTPDAMEINFTGNIGMIGLENGFVGVSQDKGVTFTFNSTALSGADDFMAAKVLPNGKLILGDRKGQIFESTDMGATWTNKYSNTTNLNVYELCASVNSNTVVAVRAGMPLRSTDGGATYSIVNVGGGTHFQTVIPTTGAMIDIGGNFPAPNFTIAAWDINRIEADGSKTLLSSFTASNIGSQAIVDIHMANDNVGYIMARATNTVETVIYKTTDGWQTTTPVAVIPTSGYSAFCGRFQTFGPDTVLIHGAPGGSSNATNYYHISVDGGLTWTLMANNFTTPNASLGNRTYKMWFHNSKEFIALTSDNFTGITVPAKGVYLSLSGSASGVPQAIHENSRISLQKSLSIFPNPTVNGCTLKCDNGFSVIEIYSLEGKKCSEIFVKEEKEVKLETNEFQNGVYLLKAKLSDGSVASGKLIITGK